MKQFHVAIDGPAGSGKSTISGLIAKKLNWTHIDTGAMYRAVTLWALNNKIDLNKESEYRFLEEISISYENDQIFLNGINVSIDIRSEKVTNNVSLVSSFPYVRKKMVDLQKKAAENISVVMDGRDIGTVVLPNADLKIFLTANVEERAKRRYAENVQKGKVDHIDNVINDIIVRDEKDSTRKEAPLKKAKDAFELDTTYMTIDEVVNKIILMIEKKENL
ncbi:(d)CMP kinase [Haploplasma modicum]|jgi:CMP/dCMP kinase|uniref:(d)CMP kinase n=1 Tax=Haploplasma modicum TaxID=2150 RepID=UPI00214CD93D|nr:(d)CMP kinase [Haploplasma modicum]MCR1809055.1 (d)CMP kinase [Haploplasma modicum]